jgi:hypothetical protein
MKTATIIALSFVMIFAPVLNAGSCRRSYATPYYPPVVEKIIIKEIVVPVAIPVLIPAAVFQYLPAIQPVVPVAAAAPYVPVAAPTTVAAHGVGSQADLDRLIRDRIEAIIREKLNQQDGGPPTLILSGDPAPAAQPAPAAADIQTRALGILSRGCYTCHTQGVKTQGNVSIFVKTGDQLGFQPNVSKDKLLRAIESGDMPKNGHPITGDDLAVLKAYLR